jgi:tetratricopeptide (TPR) repeat protein
MVTVLPRGRALLSSARGFVRNRLALIVTLVAIAGVAFAGTLGVVTAMRWESRPEWLFRDSASPRRELLSTGFEVFADYPILGTGPDVFGLVYPEYSGENPRYHFHVHNGFLQAAIDAGIPGIVAMVALGGTFVWMTMSRLRRGAPQTQLTLIAATGGLLAFAAHSMVDAPNEAKSVLAMLGALGAIAALAAQDADAESNVVAKRRRLDLRKASEFAVRAFVPIGMAGLLITWARLDVAHYEYSDSLGDANAHRWGQSAEGVRHAVELDPNFAIYRFQYGSVLARDYLQTDQPAVLNEAVAQLNRGVELEPRSAIGHTNLALLYADIGQREKARDEALLAIRYANSDPSVLVAAAYALEQTGWEEDAIQAYGRVIFYNAGLADSPFWGGTTFRQRNFEEIIGSSAIIFNACSLLDLSNHDAPAGPFTRDQALDACGQYVVDRPRDLDAKVVLAEALIKSDRDHEDSRALLDDVLHRQPDFAPALTAMGSWYRAQGDTDTARDYWVRAGQLNQTDALVLLGDSYPVDAVPRQVVNALQERLDKATSEVQFPLTAILYYRRSFYRESPIDILLPGDWQTAVPGRFARAYDALDRWIPAT